MAQCWCLKSREKRNSDMLKVHVAGMKREIGQHTPVTLEAARLDISANQFSDYQFNIRVSYFVLLVPLVFYTILQWFCLVLCFVLGLRLYKIHYRIRTCFYDDCKVAHWTFANTFGGRTWVLSQPPLWMSVRFIHGYSHFRVTVTFVSIVCLQQKLSRRTIISLHQNLMLIDSIWKDYVFVKALVQFGGPFVWVL